MVDTQHRALLSAGVPAWNAWRRQHPEILPDLSQAVLSGGDFRNADMQKTMLNDADLHRVILKDADLSGALLMSTNLAHADLSGADLTGARLHKANLSGANLSRADLRHARLFGAILNGTHVKGANFDETQVGWTMFANMDLQEVMGLETTLHAGPSSLGIETILRSRGNIPISFLYGVGLQHALIEYLLSEARQRVHTLTCSIGYSLADQALAEQLFATLQALGIPCWMVPHYHPHDDVPGGTSRHNVVTSFVHRYDRLVQIFSEDTLRINDPYDQFDDIQDQVKAAQELEAQRHHRVLFPVRVDDAMLTTSKPWAIDLRQDRPMLDFTHWQDRDQYQKAFDLLLLELQREA